MKIRNVRCRKLKGTLECDAPFWEERLSRPIDIYPEHRAEGPGYSPKAGGHDLTIEHSFVEIETDEGIVGIGGPITGIVPQIIIGQFKSLLMDENPLAVEFLWDKMYRLAVHGRKGSTMMAISAIDAALWDIRGKWADAPVYQLLGGPTRERIPAYSSMLGYSVEPERAAERARAYREMGYRAQKWFFRAGPGDGLEGMERNEALAKALRAAMGPDSDLMLDCWMSWTLPYAKLMAPRLEPVNPRWIEEPVLPDKYDVCAKIRQAMPFPVSNGEHEYTRWGFYKLLEAEAQDVIQPDICWAGGITEAMKICSLASIYEVEVIPHGHSTHITAHVLASQPPDLCPIQEYLVKWNTVYQFFLEEKIEPVDGYITPSEGPGLGLVIDESLVEEESILE